MKTFYSVFYLCFLLCLPFSMVGCSEDSEPSGEIEINQLPGTARFFLSNYFPGQSPEKIERTMIRQENDQLLYRVTFPDEVKVEFNENGGWENLMAPNQSLPESLQSLLGGIIAYVKQHSSNDPFIGVENICCGECVLLNSGKKATFCYDQTCVGYGMGIEGESSLPQPVREFTEKYFPDGTFETVIEHIPDREFPTGYTFWLKNRFKRVLNDRGKWTEVNGGTEPLSASILGTLPAKVTEDLHRNYPSVQVAFIRLEGTRYTAQVSRTVCVAIDPESKPIEVPLMQAQTLAEEYLGKQSSISISHPLHSDVLNFTVRLPNGFNMLVNESASAWVSIDGDGSAFPERLVASLPKEITDYVPGCSNSEVAWVDRSVAASYLVEPANEDGLMFDSQGDFLGREKTELGASGRVYRYMRYHYSNDLDMYLGSYSMEGWVYKLGDDPQVRFDRNGNFVEIVSLERVPDTQFPGVLCGFYLFLRKK